NRRHSVLVLLPKGGQLRLILGVGAGHDQAELLVIDAQVPLPVEGELAVDGGVDQAGKADDPRAGLANACGHLHLMNGAWQLLGNRGGGSVVVIEGALGEATQVATAHFLPGEETGQEGGVAPPVGPVRETEVPPGTDGPVAVSTVDRFDRGAVRPGEVL